MSHKLIIQQIKLVTGVIPPIYGIILMFGGYFKVKISNFKVKIKKICFKQIQIGTSAILLFDK